MTTKERLHKLVDELSEQEASETLRLIAARRGTTSCAGSTRSPKRMKRSQSRRRPLLRDT